MKYCEICGRPLRCDNQSGFCSRNPACVTAKVLQKYHSDPEMRRRNFEATKDYRQAHPLHATWMNAKSRLFCKTNPKYPRYGGRGIKMYEPWVNDFPAFEQWIMTNLGPRPAGEYPSGMPMFTLDRIDNDGNYEPGNLRWADAKTQANNATQAVTLSQAAYQGLLDEIARLRALTLAA